MILGQRRRRWTNITLILKMVRHVLKRVRHVAHIAQPALRVATGQGQVRGIQDQGNVREYRNWSGKFRKMALRSGKYVLLLDKWTLKYEYVNATLCKLIVYRIYPIRIASANLQMLSIHESIKPVIHIFTITALTQHVKI